MKAVGLLVLALSVSLVGMTQAALNRTFACPDGHKAGDIWFPEGLCQQCTCSATSYQCSGCLKYNPPQNPDCEAIFDDTKKYPGCCAPRIKCKAVPAPSK